MSRRNTARVGALGTSRASHLEVLKQRVGCFFVFVFPFLVEPIEMILIMNHAFHELCIL